MTLPNFHSHDPAAPVLSLSTLEYPNYEPEAGRQPILTVGIHPWDTERVTFTDFSTLAKAFTDPRVAAIGEVGVDPLRGAPLDRQIYLLGLQLKHAKSAGLPVVLHVVRRFDLIFNLYEEYRGNRLWAVHGFRSKPDIVRQLAERDIMISFGLNFNPASAAATPEHLLLVETDDEPHSRLPEVIEAVAAARGSTPRHIAAVCRQNLNRFYGL